MGVPAEGSCGSYLEANGVLVVNANIAHKEAAAYYLQTLLGDEVQLKISRTSSWDGSFAFFLKIWRRRIEKRLTSLFFSAIIGPSLNKR